MKITSSQITLESNLTDKNTHLFKFSSFIICAFFIVFISVLTYSITVKYFPKGISSSVWEFAVERGYNKKFPLREEIMKVPARIISNVDVPKIYIDIKFKHLQKIYAKRNQALSEGVLIQGDNDFIPATIRSNNERLKVKLRLKGDWVDHLQGKKWSFRVHTKGKSHLFGHRRFSIQHPKVRGFQGEALIHEVFSQYGILSPNYSFIDVVINGDNIGIMALEEHFSKELLEKNGRKESVIIRFDETLLWEAKDGNEGNRGFGGVFNSYVNAPIDAFQSTKIKKSAYLSRELATAVGLLRGFTSNQLAASVVFDSRLMGRYLAIAQFFGIWHEIHWHNHRFYFNPLTLKLEPIPFDANMQVAKPAGTNVINAGFNRNLLKDKKIYSTYQDTLLSLEASVLNGSLVKSLQKIEQPLLRILHKEFFFLSPFNYKQLKERALNIPSFNINDNKKGIDPSIYPQFVHAYLIENSDGKYLELLNALPYPVDVQTINWVDKSGNTIPFTASSPLKLPINLQKTSINELPHSLHIKYKSPNLGEGFKLEITSNISNNSKVKVTNAQEYFEALKQPPLPAGNIHELLSTKPYLRLEGENTIAAKEGVWQVKGNIIIPNGYAFKVTGNTQLQFEQDGCLVIYGVSNFLGSADKSIVLKGIENATWHGVVVFEASERSKWSHVTVLNTTGINFPLWKLTGGVTFYKSDIDIDNSVFSGNMGEDALNIIHSKFSFEKVDITNTQSDGFDGDFVTGTISGGLFQDIGKAGGGDGVDVSGSKVALTGVMFQSINDKAISVGENSEMDISNSTMINVGTGVASKDKSSVNIIDLQIDSAHNVALMAYVKKPEFGPASLIAKQTEIINSDIPVIVQHKSYLELNGKKIKADELNVKQLYNTIMKPGVKK